MALANGLKSCCKVDKEGWQSGLLRRIATPLDCELSSLVGSNPTPSSKLQIIFQEIMILKKVIYNEKEIEFLKAMASYRANGKVNLASSNLWASGIDKELKNLEGHYLGVAGEEAVSRLINGRVDFMPRTVGDKHKADIVAGIKGEARVSVKTTKYGSKGNPPYFKANSLDELKDCTHVSLCHYNEPTLTICWIKTKKDFIDNMFQKDFGFGKRYCLDGDIE